MSATLTSENIGPNVVSDDLIERQLDELIPAPMSPLRRWFFGFSLLVLVIGLGVSWLLGILLPNPFAGGSSSSSADLIVSADRTTIETSLSLPNFSKRDVRLTAVVLDVDGLVVTNVLVRSRPESSANCVVTESDTGGTEVCQFASDAPDPFTTTSLPTVIPAGTSAEIVVTLSRDRDAICSLPASESWGTADATFDFGEGAFPPISMTHTLSDVVISDDGQQPVWINGDVNGNRSHMPVSGPAGLKSTLCEIMELS